MPKQNLIEKILNCSGKCVFPNEQILIAEAVWSRKKPGLVALDADGTIVDTRNGDHWFAFINQLPLTARCRIKQRISLFTHAESTYAQQYLSASSLYEFKLHGLLDHDWQELAASVKLRAGVVPLIKYLQTKGFQIVIISFGFQELLAKVIQQHYLANIKVLANSTRSFLDTGLIKGFIPQFTENPSSAKNPTPFNKLVSTMQVVPNTKGEILAKLLKKYQRQQNFAIGDSSGDLCMFEEVVNTGGKSILHLHQDQPGKMTYFAQQLAPYQQMLSYVCVNKDDASFEPTAGLIRQLVA